MYSVIVKKDKIANIISTAEHIDEAREHLETYVFSYIKDMVGIECMTPYIYNDSIRSPILYNEDGTINHPIKGTIKREVPSCLHRKYSKFSKNWDNIKFDYFAVRDCRKSVFGMSVYKKATRGWFSNEQPYEKIFDIDIAHSKKGKQLLVDTPWECEFCDDRYCEECAYMRDLKSHVFDQILDLCPED